MAQKGEIVKNEEIWYHGIKSMSIIFTQLILTKPKFDNLIRKNYVIYAFHEHLVAMLPHLGSRVRVGLVLKQQLCHVGVVVVSRHVEWGQPVLALDVGFGVLLKQKSGHFDVSVFGRNVKWSKTFL